MALATSPTYRERAACKARFGPNAIWLLFWARVGARRKHTQKAPKQKLSSCKRALEVRLIYSSFGLLFGVVCARQTSEIANKQSRPPDGQPTAAHLKHERPFVCVRQTRADSVFVPLFLAHKLTGAARVLVFGVCEFEFEFELEFEFEFELELELEL